MEADTLEKALIFVFVCVLKLHPTNHLQMLLTLTPPTFAQTAPLWLELPVNKTDLEGRSKGKKQWTTDIPPLRKSTWRSLCSGPHTLEVEMLVCS